MSHNALSRSISTIPMWIVQAAAAAALSGGIAWSTWASVSNWKHEVRLGVVETKVEDIHKDIEEIKQGQRELGQKMDRLIERRSLSSEDNSRLEPGLTNRNYRPRVR